MSNFNQRNQKVERQINADKVSIGVTPIVCPKCQSENQPKTRFCSECGTSLTFKCPLCETESYLGAKFCSGCGNEINKIQHKIEIAQSKRGKQREIEYHYRETPPNFNNVFLAISDKLDPRYSRTARTTLDLDEYICFQQGGNVSVYKGDNNKPDAIGALYLTNKRLIFLGSEPEFNIGVIEWSYPLNEISEASIVIEKILFLKSSYLRILFSGKVRRFSVVDEHWAEETKKQLNNGT